MIKRRVGTDGSLLASLPWTLAALAFAIAPHVQYLSLWITATFLCCAAARWQIERRRWRLPPAWSRVILALGCFIGVLATYESVSGVGPGSALLAVMAAMKLLETRKRRDQFVLLFIAIFLIMSSLLREQYLWSLPYLILGVLITMTAWLRMSAGPKIRFRRSFSTGARLIGYAAPLALAMWIFYPRIATPFWAVPIDTSSATSGLSDRMSPGDISSLSMSDAVAFRVVFEGATPEPRDLYWRALVLHKFDGRSWSGRDPSSDPRARGRLEVSGEPVRYQITMEPTRQQWLFALDMPYEWNLRQAYMGPQQQLARVLPIDQRIAYDVVSYTNYVTDPKLSKAAQTWMTDIPTGRNTRTIGLARDMRRAAGNDEQYINDVLKKFREEEYYYTLNPPALGANPVDQFLFNTRQGFCEHYASAFAAMMRSVGIPARVVLGYQGGEINPMGKYMIVRQADAHAWTEVWLQGRGWHRIDPTAAVAPERIEAGISASMFDGIGAIWGFDAPSALLHKLSLTWDSLNASWNQWILGYGPENQNRLMEWLGMEEPDWRKMLLTLIALVVVIVAVISTLLMLRYSPPRKDEAAVLYKKFTRKIGVRPGTGETPQHFALRVRNENGNLNGNLNGNVDSVTSQYLTARYGPANPEALALLRESVAAFSR
jgi:transglutaminase-like putative cysteine protease